MKDPNSRYYAEVKDKRYIIHPTENIILRDRRPPKSPGNHYQVKNEIQFRKNQKIIKNDNEALVFENYS